MSSRILVRQYPGFRLACAIATIRIRSSTTWYTTENGNRRITNRRISWPETTLSRCHAAGRSMISSIRPRRQRAPSSARGAVNRTIRPRRRDPRWRRDETDTLARARSGSGSSESCLCTASQPGHGSRPVLQPHGTALDVLYPACDLRTPRRFDVAMIVGTVQALEESARCLGAIGRRELEQRLDELGTGHRCRSVAQSSR